MRVNNLVPGDRIQVMLKGVRVPAVVVEVVPTHNLVWVRADGREVTVVDAKDIVEEPVLSPCETPVVLPNVTT